MTRKELIEAMAAAFFESRMNAWRDGEGREITWEHAADTHIKQEHIAASKAALTAIDRLGLAVVSRIPTPEMAHAIYGAWDNVPEAAIVEPRAVLALYAAMIAAGNLASKEGGDV